MTEIVSQYKQNFITSLFHHKDFFAPAIMTAGFAYAIKSLSAASLIKFMILLSMGYVFLQILEEIANEGDRIRTMPNSSYSRCPLPLLVSPFHHSSRRSMIGTVLSMICAMLSALLLFLFI